MNGSEFYLKCLRRAFSGKLALAQFFSGLLSLIALPIGYKWNAPVEYLNWLPFSIFSAVFIGTFVYGFLRAPVDLLSEASAEIDHLRLMIEDRDAWQKALNELWKLRKSGVELRNQNITDAEYDLWKEDVNRWRADVCREARKISENLEQWLSILDQVTQGTITSIKVEKQIKDLEIMSEILHRLQVFLEKDLRWPKMGSEFTWNPSLGSRRI